MKDSYGREIDYMRISITDRCNLRCSYCMPHGIQCVPPQDILTLEEIQAAAIAAGKLGIRHIKITGGEPLTRKGCCELVSRIKAVPGIEKVTLTTNGILLDRYLDSLAEAGIDGINISLDTLDRERYKKITGRDGLAEVLSGLERAVSLGIPTKVNAVSVDWQACEIDWEERQTAEESDWQMTKERKPQTMDGKNLDKISAGKPDWMDLVELAKKYPVDVRFIEMMPIGYGRRFKSLDHQELLAQLREAYPGLEKDENPHGFGPAVYYRIPGFLGSIGLISAIHGKFCKSCNRVRLTAQGYLKTCLCFEDGADLRAVLRKEQGGLPGEKGYGTPDNRLANGHWKWKYRDCPGDTALQKSLTEVIETAVNRKPAEHCFEQPDKITEAHSMIAIGG